MVRVTFSSNAQKRPAVRLSLHQVSELELAAVLVSIHPVG